MQTARVLVQPGQWWAEVPRWLAGLQRTGEPGGAPSKTTPCTATVDADNGAARVRQTGSATVVCKRFMVSVVGWIGCDAGAESGIRTRDQKAGS